MSTYECVFLSDSVNKNLSFHSTHFPLPKHSLSRDSLLAKERETLAPGQNGLNFKIPLNSPPPNCLTPPVTTDPRVADLSICTRGIFVEFKLEFIQGVKDADRGLVSGGGYLCSFSRARRHASPRQISFCAFMKGESLKKGISLVKGASIYLGVDFYVMEDNISVATLVDSTASKIQQLQKAFAELESHRAITLNLKWKQLEEHFNGLQKSLKRRFTELEEQEKEFETKIIDSREMLEKRKAAVVAKEQDSLERLQEKRNAAVSAILTVMDNRGKPFSIDPGVTSRENQAEEPVLDEKKPDAMVTESNLAGMKKPFENMHVQVKSYPELVNLCQQMNSEGLHKFISDNRKNLAILKEEIPIALKAAADPASLVLDSLTGFYDMEVPNSDARKDSSLLGIRRTCIMLMECLSSLFVNLDLHSLSGIISEKVKERAKSIAEEWKQNLDYLDVDANNGNSLEAHAFLQLLATFGINSDFDQEMLSRLIPMVSRRRQTAELCRYLGLSDKMPGVIDVLVRNGRQIDAVNLAFAFELTDQFSPISLLKSYLSEVKKVSSAAKPGNLSPTASTQSDVNEKELTALKAVIKCIEDHKLEEQFPVNPLQKQVLDIEKAKADKKRATEVAKPQSKRPRANGVGHAPRVCNAATDKNFYSRMTDRYPPYIYDRPYAYPGPTDHHVPSFLGTATYNFSHNHGNFFGNAYQYQPAYLH